LFGGWEVDVEHLDAASLSGTARGVRPAASGLSRARSVDVRTISEEGHEDVRLNALLQLVMDRP